ncbi:hypothetical protein PENANT_c015G05231 [Penicillium antarcticum]|uniref:ER membrane protein complex subunit 7 beta-sandwich domain-containing protein n=1 Tax=Penicillium antarcticum TaxID=416450 RepID=A0A1V6Q350_9EURO|nr:hypothetical protein PENANT_c015G05231 [Penicillium antarcticum]
MLQVLTLGLILSLFTAVVHANVEKNIFLAPPETTIPSEQPDLDDLGLERLSPQNPIVRTRLNASFPTTDAPNGVESWFFLENLNPGQRYEVRQPTSFTLSTYPLNQTISNKTLLSSLSIYTNARLASLDNELQSNSIQRHTIRPPSKKGGNDPLDPSPTSDSVLFLRIHAAADYFSTDAALMRDVPAVAVDVILDPFLMNVFPRSLVPTALWILAVALLAAVVSKWVAGEVGRVVEDARGQSVLEDMKKK